MLHKIQLLFFFVFLFSSSLLAGENEHFAAMAYRFINNNRSVLHCELQQDRVLVIQTVKGKELKVLCLWFPQTQERKCRLDDLAIFLINEVVHVLIGYGQTAGNQMFCYYLPIKKVSKEMKKRKWEKYKVPLSLCDYHFK